MPPDIPTEGLANAPTLVLCDFAEVLNGKLYIMGAGWSRTLANVPVPIAIAVIWKIPWDRANHAHDIKVALVTQDGAPVTDADGKAITLEGKIEVGRPPGLKQGWPLEAPLAMRLPPLPFEPGVYRFEFSVDGEPSAFAAFEAIGGQSS